MSTPDIISGLEALDAARPAYLEAQEMYEGAASETFSSPVLQRVLGSDSPEFSFNYARLVITSRLSRMEISSVLSQDDRANDELAKIWSENALDQEFQDAFEASLVFGDAYLIASVNEDSVDVFYNSPLDTRVFYDVENPRKKTYAIKRWAEGGKLRVNLYYADRTERYISKGKVQSTYAAGDFTEYEVEGEAWPLMNETGSVPVFHLRTGRMYGTPEHKQAFGPQRAITKLLASQMDSIDYQSGPQRYILQDSAEGGVNPASDFGVDDDDNDNLSSLKSGPGGIWSLKGAKSVGQFDPASPDIFVTPFKTFIEAIGTTTSTPVHTFNVGALPSGESLRAAEAPLNKRVESIETLFGGVIRELHEYALDAIGYVDVKVLVSWSPTATYDSKDVWETVKTKTDAGVPLRVALMEAGYTATQLDEWYPEGETARSLEDLATLAESMTKLASAVSLGLISREEARLAIPSDLLIESEVADAESLPEVSADLETAPDVNSEAQDMASMADALGVLIRAGVDPSDAAERVGLGGLTFTGATPTTLRQPQADAAKLEEI